MLTERVRVLEETVVKLGTTQAERARYELRTLGNDSLGYMLKPKERGTEPPHWTCSNCFRESEKSICSGMCGRREASPIAAPAAAAT
jgi:hypothetical protein